MASCAECLYRGRDEAEKKTREGVEHWASCRINPPLVSSNCVVPSADLWAGQWPATRRFDWCGSFKPGNNRAVAVRVGTPTVEG